MDFYLSASWPYKTMRSRTNYLFYCTIHSLVGHQPETLLIGTRVVYCSSFKQTVGGQSCKDHRSERGFALVEYANTSFIADRLTTCYSACNTQPAWQSLNYNFADKTCEFDPILPGGGGGVHCA